MGMYHRLVTYKEEHAGSALVPQKYSKDPQLRKWVSTQRTAYKKKELPKDRITLLKSIDFAWDGRAQKEARENTNWMNMYQRLASYKEEHSGSTLVPRVDDKYPKLGQWVSNQRSFCKKKERAKLLNDINFVWNAKRK